MISFTKPATYAGARQLEAWTGDPIHGDRLVLREIRGHPGYWNVYTPARSAAPLHGEAVVTAEELVQAGCRLREAKAFAAVWLELAEGVRDVLSTGA